MILEAAYLIVKKGKETDFEKDFLKAGKYISSIKGYQKHTLQKCIEQSNKYLLLVNWDTLEDHEIGFKQSDAYQLWKKLLHHYYHPFPTVSHFKTIV